MSLAHAVRRQAAEVEPSFDFWRPHLIRDEAEYDAVIAEIERLLDLHPVAGSEDYERLEFFTVLAQDYEKKHYPVPPVTPQEAVDFRLEQRGMTRADLAKPLGGKSRVSEFFSGKRKLSRRQIEALRDLLGISVERLF